MSEIDQKPSFELIERSLSSRGRIRLLYLLAKHEMLNITSLAKEAHLSFEVTRRHLGNLLELGIVEEHRLGRIRIFRLNKRHPMTRKILALFSLKERETK
ncbi:MAG: ArsR family transcriptional regulator [Thermoproteota archaeon]|nr:MAG: ArsR family transcriptional regulator [Candidatus Korarchaeota archaeon]